MIAVSDYGENDQPFKKAIEEQVAVVTGWWTSTELDPDLRFTVEVPNEELLSLRQVREFLHTTDLAEAEDDDALVIYITGHGERGVSGRHYLRLAGTKKERLPGTALTTSEVIAAALSSHSRHVLIMVDSCFSGTLRSELAVLLDDLGRSRRRLNSLAVVTAGDFEDSPTVGSFTGLIQRALAKAADEPTGFTSPYLSFDQWEDLLQEAHEEQTGSVEPRWVWPSRLTQDPSPCLPNPRYQGDEPLVSPALRELSVPATLFTSHWQDRASGRTSNEDAGWYFSGRAEAMRTLTGFLREGVGALVVTGAAGSGKSALLARLVTLTDRVFLEDPRYTELAQAVAPQDRPPIGAIDAAVLARGKTSLELLTDLLQASGAAPATPGEAPLKALLGHLERLASDRLVTVVIDGLDEAQAPSACLSDVVLPLAGLRNESGRRVTRVLLGVRSSPTVGSAADRLQDERADTLLDSLQRALADDREPVPTALLRTDGPDCEEDIAAYTKALLLAGPSPAYQDPETAQAAAAVIASATAPSFLDARLAADQLRNTTTVQNLQDQAWQARLASGTVALLQEDLLDVAASARVSPDMLLAALRATAFAFGAGLPWDKVWPAAAGALLPTPLTQPVDDDALDAAIRLIRSSRLDGYLARGEEDGRTVYRPVHQRVTEELQSSPTTFSLPAPEPISTDATPSSGLLLTEACHRRIAKALAQLVRRGPHETAHPYIRRYLLAHADAGNVLRDEYVPNELLNQETSLTLRSRLGMPLPVDSPAQTNLTAAALIEPYITPWVDPSSRASSIYFQLSALRQASRLSPSLLAAPRGVAWEPATNVLASPPGAVKTLASFELRDGRTLLAAGTKHGVHLWDASSGQHLFDLDTGLVFGMSAIRGSSGRVFLAVGGPRGAAIYDPLSGLQIAQTEVPRHVTDLQVLADGAQRWRLLLRSGMGLHLWRPDGGSQAEMLPYEGKYSTALRDQEGSWLLAHQTPTGVRVHGLDVPDDGVEIDLLRGLPLQRIPRWGMADLLMATRPGRGPLFWDPLSGRLSAVRDRLSRPCVVPNQDGSVTLAGLRNRHAVIWQQDDDSWHLAAELDVGHHIVAITALPSRQGKWRLATAGEHGIRLWETSQGTLSAGAMRVASRRDGLEVGAVSPTIHGGEKAWAVALKGGVHLVRHADLMHLHERSYRRPVYEIFPAAPVRNPELLAVQTDQTIEVWDVDSDETRLSLPADPATRACAISFPSDASDRRISMPALCVASPLAGVGVHPLLPDSTVPACSFEPPSRITSLVQVPCPETVLVAIAAGRWVFVWDLANNVLVTRVSTRSSTPVVSMCTVDGPDGLLLAAATRDAIRVWKAHDWTRVTTMDAPGTKRLTRFVRGDGSSSLASGDGHSVRLWDPWTGTPLHTLLTAAPIRTLAGGRPDGVLAFGGQAGFAVVNFSSTAP